MFRAIGAPPSCPETEGAGSQTQGLISFLRRGTIKDRFPGWSAGILVRHGPVPPWPGRQESEPAGKPEAKLEQYRG